MIELGETDAMATAWSCSLHVDDVEKNLTTARRALDVAYNLGCRFMRTDLSWRDVEPEQNVHSSLEAQFYRDFFAAVKLAGLAPLVILSGAPDWAKDLHTTNVSAFLEAVEEYAAYSLPLLGDANASAPSLRVQLWNELNHVPSLWVRSSACGLLSALGRGAARAFPRHQLQLWVNVMADDPLWQNAVDHWVAPTCARAYIDGLGIDHYPGTWSIGAWTNWDPLRTLLRRVSSPPTDPWSGLRPAVLETGFSSWSHLLASEADQARWVNASLPAMLDVAAAQGTRLELVNWYTLIDGRPKKKEPVPQEAHFGVVRWSTLEPKPAYAPLAAQMRMLRRSGASSL